MNIKTKSMIISIIITIIIIGVVTSAVLFPNVALLVVLIAACVLAIGFTLMIVYNEVYDYFKNKEK